MVELSVNSLNKQKTTINQSMSNNFALVESKELSFELSLVNDQTSEELRQFQQLKSIAIMPNLGALSTVFIGTTKSEETVYYRRGANPCFELPSQKVQCLHEITEPLVDLKRVKFVALGHCFAAVLTDEQKLLRFAEDTSFKQLIHPALATNQVVSMKAGYESIYLLFDNQMCIRVNRKLEFREPFYDILSVYPADRFALFIKTDGWIYGHGEGDNGQFANTQQVRKKLTRFHRGMDIDFTPEILLRSQFENESVQEALIPATHKVLSITSNRCQTMFLNYQSRLFICGLYISDIVIEVVAPDVTAQGVTKIAGYYPYFFVLTQTNKVYVGQQRLQLLDTSKLVSSELVPVDIVSQYYRGLILLGRCHARYTEELMSRLLNRQKANMLTDIIIHCHK